MPKCRKNAKVMDTKGAGAPFVGRPKAALHDFCIFPALWHLKCIFSVLFLYLFCIFVQILSFFLHFGLWDAFLSVLFPYLFCTFVCDFVFCFCTLVSELYLFSVFFLYVVPYLPPTPCAGCLRWCICSVFSWGHP